MNEDHGKNLLANGYTVIKNKSYNLLEDLSTNLLLIVNELSDKKTSRLEDLHQLITPDQINEIRLKFISFINENNSIKLELLSAIEPELKSILGPDVAVQKNINLVTSLPNDPTSQIPLHSDTLTGHSIFELVIWIPLTEVKKTQSMFIMPLNAWKNNKDFWNSKGATINSLIKEHKDSLHFLELNRFDIVLFWHNLPHGNTLNKEDISRCSLNFRVKNLFTPYKDKGLGDYFLPWSYGPVTQLALEGSHS